MNVINRLEEQPQAVHKEPQPADAPPSPRPVQESRPDAVDGLRAELGAHVANVQAELARQNAVADGFGIELEHVRAHTETLLGELHKQRAETEALRAELEQMRAEIAAMRTDAASREDQTAQLVAAMTAMVELTKGAQPLQRAQSGGLRRSQGWDGLAVAASEPADASTAPMVIPKLAPDTAPPAKLKRLGVIMPVARVQPMHPPVVQHEVHAATG
jgi:hypothetical protein